jgi:hypothetical protein
LALFPLPDLTAEAAPGSHGPNGLSAITLACTVSTREEVDTAFAAAVAAGATPVADATDRTARRTSRAPCGPRTLAKLSPASAALVGRSAAYALVFSRHTGRTRLSLVVAVT